MTKHSSRSVKPKLRLLSLLRKLSAPVAGLLTLSQKKSSTGMSNTSDSLSSVQAVAPLFPRSIKPINPELNPSSLASSSMVILRASLASRILLPIIMRSSFLSMLHHPLFISLSKIKGRQKQKLIGRKPNAFITYELEILIS